MSRLKSFAAPHKALRNILAQFSLVTGQTEFSDPEQVNRLKSLGNEMFALLTEHAQTENSFTLRHLEERVAGSAEHDLHDHEVLEGVQEALQQRLLTLDGTQTQDEAHAFYLSFSHFQSRYLEHIYEEETVTEKLLQANFSDEELMQHRIEIMQHIDFTTMLRWFKYLIPAQTENENVDMLSGFKSSAPAAAFEQVTTLIKQVLPERIFNSLITKLS